MRERRDSGHFEAQLTRPGGKKVSLGTYKTAVEAAVAYARAVEADRTPQPTSKVDIDVKAKVAVSRKAVNKMAKKVAKKRAYKRYKDMKKRWRPCNNRRIESYIGILNYH